MNLQSVKELNGQLDVIVEHIGEIYNKMTMCVIEYNDTLENDLNSDQDNT